MSHWRDMSWLLPRASLFAGLKPRAIARSSVWPALLIAVLILLLARTSPAEQRRERIFDEMLAWLPRAPRPEIVIVDIDRPSLAARGSWPWGRDKIAALIAAVADAKPRAIGVDVLIEGPDERSPAALARRLAEISGRDEIRRLVDTLPDGNRQLAEALRKAPTSLGVGLDPARGEDRAPPTPVLIRGRAHVEDFWHAEGLIEPIETLARAAAGLGVLLLPGDADGRARRVPLLVVAHGRLWPSLAVEVVRMHGGASAVLLAADRGRLEIAGRSVPIGSEGMLRLLPVRDDSWRQRTVSAVDILDKPETRQRLAGHIVLIGSSAPELGGLRTAVPGPLVPSVMLHAAGVEQILNGVAPIRNATIETVEVLTAIAFCVLGMWLAHVLPPLMGSLAAAGLAIAWTGAAAALLWWQLLIDPLLVPSVTLVSFTVAAISVAAVNRRREAAMRRRFEQHLAPEVVSRLVAQPELLRLEGEMREITALFTDIEGFTSMTERVDPRTLVGLLDRYFDGLTRIVVEHRGMVEKMVGDGLHALFNAPLDLAEHPRHAVECAIALRDFGERFRKDEQAAAAGFGRTRIGVETGVVVVGDVGGGRKLDYTAHGEAMNMAARFESANKDLGSSICIGPTTAARLPNRALRPLGRIEVRGRSTPADVFDPWPDALDKAARKTYLKAVALAERDPRAAAARLQEIASLVPNDPVPARFAARLLDNRSPGAAPELDRSRRPSHPQAARRGAKKKRR